MSPLTPFLIFMIFLNVTSQSYGCLVWRDLYIYYENTTSQNLTLHFYTSPRTSWVGIKFLSSYDNKSPVLAISASVYNLTIHESTSTGYNFESEIDESIFFMIDNILHFKVTLSTLYFEKFKFVHFNQKDQGADSNYEITGKKKLPLYEPKNNFLDTYCDPEYLKLAGRFGAQTIVIYVLFMLFYIICIILSVYFRDNQPLKSREMGPIFCCFFISVDLTGDFLLTHAITYEQYYYVDCFVSNFIIYPCGMAT